MKKITIKINSIEDIKKFQDEITKFETDIDITRGRYIIDAKSMLGILTIDLSKPIDVVLHSDDEVEINNFKEIMKQFQVV